MTHAAPPSTLQAPAYGLLLGHTECHFCHAPTPTAAIWVPSFEEHDDEGLVDQGEGAVLRYIERLDENTAAFVAGHAPWLRFATTRTSGQTYLAHHCTTCGALQGDHFVFSPDGPYWPQSDVELARLTDWTRISITEDIAWRWKLKPASARRTNSSEASIKR